ncbi:MAG: hypothetical protein DRR16_10845 [Candidatus Parabeggiatoa sp. nov. 3]|nr:MAG: hypothetical protein DRR00_09920 [Gammaproteobacteria bacterium]RKZ67718.1 MAG: hypothetical protein DRQ99_05835 [Gammaproteobacteria bacterium]RKZ85958.1 MAG: hypothetical protein DRR16_10845 [Gammaproteobacteria bacterium]
MRFYLTQSRKDAKDDRTLINIILSAGTNFTLGAFPKKGSFRKFCGPLGMPVILRPAWNACYFAARLECLLFCGPLGMPVILRPAGNACYFAAAGNACYFAFVQIMTLFLGMRPLTFHNEADGQKKTKAQLT